jgi:hypothetical protein
MPRSIAPIMGHEEQAGGGEQRAQCAVADTRTEQMDPGATGMPADRQH